MGQSKRQRSALDVIRASYALIAKLGMEAPGYAARHAHELLKAGDIKGYGYWSWIRLAAYERLASAARHSEPVEDKTDEQALKEKEKAWQERTEKVAKLRALRLAKEAADKEAAEEADAE